jgi:hypothetical protein
MSAIAVYMRCGPACGLGRSYLPPSAGDLLFDKGPRTLFAEAICSLTLASNLSSGARPLEILNASSACFDLEPQSPSDGPCKYPSSIRRF